MKYDVDFNKFKTYFKEYLKDNALFHNKRSINYANFLHYSIERLAFLPFYCQNYAQCFDFFNEERIVSYSKKAKTLYLKNRSAVEFIKGYKADDLIKFIFIEFKEVLLKYLDSYYELKKLQSSNDPEKFTTSYEPFSLEMFVNCFHKFLIKSE